MRRRPTNSSPHRVVAVQITFPVFASKATMPAFFPPTLAITFPPSTNGEPAAPKNPLSTPNCRIVSTFHSAFPVARSIAWSFPSAPNV